MARVGISGWKCSQIGGEIGRSARWRDNQSICRERLGFSGFGPSTRYERSIKSEGARGSLDLKIGMRSRAVERDEKGMLWSSMLADDGFEELG